MKRVVLRILLSLLVIGWFHLCSWLSGHEARAHEPSQLTPNS
jgi:hypothetical protein